VLNDPRRILNTTVAVTAGLANVSQPTVIGFCTSVGCEGFLDFKLRLAQSLAFGLPASHSVIVDADGPKDVAEKIFDYMMTSLDWARRHLDTNELSRAMDSLVTADRIEFFGFGAPCGAETNSRQQAMVASCLKPGDMAVVISNTAATRSVIEIARLARESGETVIVLVGMRGPLVERCDIVLPAETLENTNIYTPTISPIAAPTVIDIPSAAVVMRCGEDHIAKLTKMKRNLAYLRVTERL